MDASCAAQAIFDHFRAYRREFETITAAARERFLSADWPGVQDASSLRLNLYNVHIEAVLESMAGARDAASRFAAPFWPEVKSCYRARIASRPDGELAETVYNSVYRRAIGTANPVDDHMFIHSSFEQAPPASPDPVFTTYAATGRVDAMLKRVLEEQVGAVAWRHLDRDVANILDSLAGIGLNAGGARDLKIDVVTSLFYRNKGAYLVGRLRSAGGNRPFALPLSLDEERLVYVDTLICDEDELSIVFSFTRAYFMVRASYPFGLVEFLHGLLPNKKRSEIYASIGEHRHGKTEFYRDFLKHLDNSSDRFVIAPGIKGTVMTVFALPSYQTAFKVIKDRFALQKDVTANDVRNRYYMVKSHDRVGRMADTQEFENLTLPLSRLAPELLDELQSVAGASFAVDGNEVRIGHLYTERLMTPLNLYIETARGEALTDALDEYGNAIKQLAAANIFPGDLLLKNFGVTRHGRVVFYDYDEICYLTDINFRAIPEARNPQDEMAAEPWYSVAPNDVFPEEFRRFLFGRAATKRLFAQMHGELFDPAYWRELQRAIRDGQVIDVFPYRRKNRFSAREAARARVGRT